MPKIEAAVIFFFSFFFTIKSYCREGVFSFVLVLGVGYLLFHMYFNNLLNILDAKCMKTLSPTPNLLNFVLCNLCLVFQISGEFPLVLMKYILK